MGRRLDGKSPENEEVEEIRFEGGGAHLRDWSSAKVMRHAMPLPGPSDRQSHPDRSSSLSAGIFSREVTDVLKDYLPGKNHLFLLSLSLFALN